MAGDWRKATVNLGSLSEGVELVPIGGGCFRQEWLR